MNNNNCFSIIVKGEYEELEENFEVNMKNKCGLALQSHQEIL